MSQCNATRNFRNQITVFLKSGRLERFPFGLTLKAQAAQKALWIRCLSRFLSENRCPLFREML
jgi:hypothetical protein